jgi:hypothetical protein
MLHPSNRVFYKALRPATAGPYFQLGNLFLERTFQGSEQKGTMIGTPIPRFVTIPDRIIITAATLDNSSRTMQPIRSN